jgi:GGDEF domain-containing protein
LRIPEELGRANRYRRWLCGILLKVIYTYLPGRGRQPALEETFLAAYVHYVKESIRESDMGFSMQDGEFLLLLPETPQQGAKDTALKLIELPETLTEMKKDYPFSVDIEYGFLYYSGNYPLLYDQFIQKLYASLGGGAE